MVCGPTIMHALLLLPNTVGNRRFMRNITGEIVTHDDALSTIGTVLRKEHHELVRFTQI